MSDEREVRAKVQEALGTAEPHPGLRSRVMASMPIEPAGSSRRQWAAGAVAVVLALTIVTGLLVARQRGSARPAASGHLAGTLVMTTQLDFRCTLPVQGYLSAARISFPDGSVTVDREQQSKGSPGFGNVYVAGRWLPVPLAWVSADGRSYAYITSTSGVPGQPPTTALYVHDIARGGDRQLWSGTGYAQMIGWGPGGVFFMHQSAGASKTGPMSATEVWVVDPANPSAAHRVGPNPAQPASPGEALVPLFQTGTRIGGDAAWTVRINKVQGPVVPPGGIPGSPSQIVRMDLRDGSVSTWFTAPDGTSVSIAGVDQQGRPILVLATIPRPVVGPASSAAPEAPPATLIYPPPPRVVLLSGPNQTAEISSGSDPAFRPLSTMADSHGIWFASPGSLWLYRQGSLARVADVPASLFPLPSPPPNAPTPPPNYTKPSPPPGYPAGVPLTLAGPCR